MSIKFDRDTALDLIHTKLENLDIKINEILTKWDYSNIDDFIEDVKNGVIDDEGVDYAIDLENLRNKRDRTAALLNH